MSISSDFDRLHKKLAESVVACRVHTGRHAVHSLRTGTRKLEAVLNKLLEDHPGAARLHKTGRKALRELKRVRKAAGPVRDLDVHRKLAQELHQKDFSGRRQDTNVDDEFAKLDRQLQRRRKRAAGKLERTLKKHELSLEAALEKTAGEIDHLHAASPAPLATAREWARRAPLPAAARADSSFEDQLHGYRKQTKAARYVAGLQESSAAARRLAQRLKKVQDSIGRWHDLLLLSDESADILGKHSVPTRAAREACDRALDDAARRLHLHEGSGAAGVPAT